MADDLDFEGLDWGSAPMGALSAEDMVMPDYLKRHYDAGTGIMQNVGPLNKYEQQSMDALAAKRAAIQKGLDALLAEKPDYSAMLMAMGSGLLKPTRTGRFGESLGQAGEAAIQPLIKTQEQSRANKLKALEFQLADAGVEGDMAKTQYQAALERLKLGRGVTGDALKMYNQGLLFKARQAGSRDLVNLRERLARGRALSPEGKQAADEGYEPGSLEHQQRTQEIANEKNRGKGMGPTGRQAQDEGYEPGSEDFNRRVAELNEIKNLSVGQQALDRSFAKEYSELITGGGADAEKNLAQLQNVLNRLRSGENLTGWLQGRLPNAVRSITAAPGLDVQQQVEEVVQRNLRLILGAQFTEKEGERFISRAYDPTLDEKTNLARLNRAMEAMKQAYRQKLAAAEYFSQKGTLKGYKGPTSFTTDDLARMANLGTKERVIVGQEDLP